MRIYALTNLLRRHWFLISLVMVIFMARWDPSVGCKGGPLYPEVNRTFKLKSVRKIT